MATQQKPQPRRANPEPNRARRQVALSEEDARDLRDARRALAEAEREGVYPLDGQCQPLTLRINQLSPDRRG